MNMSVAIAKRIKYYLKEKKMTQYKLGQLAAIPHNTMQGIMHAKYIGMNTKNLFSIIKALDLTIIEFFNNEMFDLNNICIE